MVSSGKVFEVFASQRRMSRLSRLAQRRHRLAVQFQEDGTWVGGGNFEAFLRLIFL